MATRISRGSTFKGPRRTQSRWWADKGYAGLVGSFVEAVRDGTRRR